MNRGTRPSVASMSRSTSSLVMGPFRVASPTCGGAETTRAGITSSRPFAAGPSLTPRAARANRPIEHGGRRWANVATRAREGGRAQLGLAVRLLVRQPRARQEAVEPCGHPPGARAEQAQGDGLQEQADQDGV